MRAPTRPAWIAVAILLTAGSPPVFAAPVAEHELAGSYVLPDGEWDRIEATFSPTGSDSWRVEFRFDFQGRSEIWSGDAVGSLANGPIEGSVEVFPSGRRFVFRGATTDGVLQATHAEREFGGETPTGAMTLAPADSGSGDEATAPEPAPAESDVVDNSAHTLRLADGATRPRASLADLAWLAGYWKGEGFGGVVEELWLPAAGDRMHGIFTLTKDGRAVFSEAMQLAEEEDSLVLRVKHFTPEFVGWEEKDGMVRFPLVRLGAETAWFSGLTLRRDGERLVIHIVLSQGGERSEHELTLERVPL